MSMRYTPRSEEEAKKLSIKEPLKNGTYDGLITEAIEKLTRETRKEMWEVTIKIGDHDVKDWIVGESDIAAQRLRHLAEAIGKLDLYESQELTVDDLPGQHVKVVLSIRRGSKGFLSRNVVDDYQSPTSSVVQLRKVE